MKKVDDLLEPALELAREFLQSKDKPGAINKTVKSDISSFGTAIQQCGLLPATAMYSNPESESGKRGVKMLNIIFALLEEDAQGKTPPTDTLLALLSGIDIERKQLLLENLLNPDTPIRRRETMQACIALKLAVRTFDLQEVNDEQP